MIGEKDIVISRKLFRQYNYVITTASRLYYADIKLLLEKGLIEKN